MVEIGHLILVWKYYSTNVNLIHVNKCSLSSSNFYSPVRMKLDVNTYAVIKKEHYQLFLSRLSEKNSNIFIFLLYIFFFQFPR